METYDAIIVGYGPTGATLANLLGHMGQRVAVVERDRDIYDKPRAITADHESMRAFQAAGLAEKIEQGTCPHPGTDFVGLEGQVIKRFYPLPAPGPLGWEPTFMFYQPKLEGVLREGAGRFDKVDVLLERTLVALRQDAEGVEADVTAPGQPRQTLRGKYLLACDGARSTARGLIGSPVHDLAFDEWWVVVDADLHTRVELPDRCVQYCRPSRPGTYIVGPGRLRRWEIKLMPGETPESFDDPAYLQTVLARFVDTSGITVQRVAVYRFHAVVAEKWREGRVFLLGDAAHQTPPFLGQGMCAGIRDVYNLAWKLDAVLKGRADDGLLDTYGAERRPHVQTVVAHAKTFGLIIGELDEAAARERDKRLGAELAAGTAPTIRQSFIPGLSTGLLALDARGQPTAGAGALFPQPWVSGRRADKPFARSRLDDVVRGDFYVVSTDPALAQSAVRRFAASARLTGARAVYLGGGGAAGNAYAGADVIAGEEEIDLVHGWLAGHGGKAALVRPDGFAYGVADTAQRLDALIAELDAALDGQRGAQPARATTPTTTTTPTARAA